MAFCGFYVAKADKDLFNSASQVVLVRDDDRTVITMANDFKGDVTEFATVIPVPTFLEEDQINVGSQLLIDHLDAYTAPRLVEYYDDNPCDRRLYQREDRVALSMSGQAVPEMVEMEKGMGVTIEAEYAVGEYDILILSAEESSGLIQWLKSNGYRLPDGAEKVVGSYLKQGMRFFVAKVNLQRHESGGYQDLSPLQIAFESPKFMLPIRLGNLNADGKQELFVYTLTRTGRVETSNYRTVKMPADVVIPSYVKAKFSDFYRDMFTTQSEKQHGKAVFLEYAWDMAWCDPCAADPLTTTQLRDLGVYWLADNGRHVQPNQAQNVFVTRLHVRYDQDTFPDDLKFIETGDRSNYQGRYVMHHAYGGEMNCSEAKDYRRMVNNRNVEAGNLLASLTGWDRQDIASSMKIDVLPSEGKWWRKIWRK